MIVVDDILLPTKEDINVFEIFILIQQAIFSTETQPGTYIQSKPSCRLCYPKSVPATANPAVPCRVSLNRRGFR